MQSFVKALRNLAWMTQMGMSVAVPLVLCILSSAWLKNRFDLGGWIFIPGIFLGLGGAVSGLWSCLNAMQHTAQEDDGDFPISFNEHE